VTKEPEQVLEQHGISHQYSLHYIHKPEDSMETSKQITQFEMSGTT
jgi:hypothetical protein